MIKFQPHLKSVKNIRDINYNLDANTVHIILESGKLSYAVVDLETGHVAFRSVNTKSTLSRFVGSQAVSVQSSGSIDIVDCPEHVKPEAEVYGSIMEHSHAVGKRRRLQFTGEDPCPGASITIPDEKNPYPKETLTIPLNSGAKSFVFDMFEGFEQSVEMYCGFPTMKFKINGKALDSSDPIFQHQFDGMNSKFTVKAVSDGSLAGSYTVEYILSVEDIDEPYTGKFTV